MNFSPYQWFTLIMLDLLMRASYFFLTSFNVLTLPIALFLSVTHLVVLILVGYAVLDFEFTARTAAAVTISTTNLIFCVVVISIWLAFVSSGRQTLCEGFEYKCYWIKGSVTWLGVRYIALQVLVQVLISILSVCLVCASSATCRKALAQR
jgi:hypothetical protein